MLLNTLMSSCRHACRRFTVLSATVPPRHDVPPGHVHPLGHAHPLGHKCLSVHAQPLGHEQRPNHVQVPVHNACPTTYLQLLGHDAPPGHVQPPAHDASPGHLGRLPGRPVSPRHVQPLGHKHLPGTCSRSSITRHPGTYSRPATIFHLSTYNTAARLSLATSTLAPRRVGSGAVTAVAGGDPMPAFKTTEPPCCPLWTSTPTSWLAYGATLARRPCPPARPWPQPALSTISACICPQLPMSKAERPLQPHPT